MSIAHQIAQPARSARVVNFALWFFQVVLAAAFLMAAAFKLGGAQMMVDNFEKIGVGQWFRYLTGGLELVGGVMLLVPAQAGRAAVLLATIMVGAVVAHLVVFKDSPLPPLVFFVFLAVVAWGRLARPRAIEPAAV